MALPLLPAASAATTGFFARDIAGLFGVGGNDNQPSGEEIERIAQAKEQAAEMQAATRIAVAGIVVAGVLFVWS